MPMLPVNRKNLIQDSPDFRAGVSRHSEILL